jgi:hypothetical protein
MIRELNKIPQIDDYSISMIEALVNEKLPEYFKIFLKVNAGFSHYECIFIAKDKVSWEVNSYMIFSGIYKVAEEILSALNRRMVPFAIDGGGWHYCLSVEDDKNSVYVNRWTDHLPEDQLLKIADSFEEFIDGLKREDEV